MPLPWFAWAGLEASDSPNIPTRVRLRRSRDSVLERSTGRIPDAPRLVCVIEFSINNFLSTEMVLVKNNRARSDRLPRLKFPAG